MKKTAKAVAVFLLLWAFLPAPVFAQDINQDPVIVQDKANIQACRNFLAEAKRSGNKLRIENAKKNLRRNIEKLKADQRRLKSHQ